MAILDHQLEPYNVPAAVRKGTRFRLLNEFLSTIERAKPDTSAIALASEEEKLVAKEAIDEYHEALRREITGEG